MIKWISFTFTLLNIISYAWSVIGVFKKIKNINFKKQFFLKLFSVLNWISIIFIFTNSNRSQLSYSINFIIQFILLVLFWKTSTIVKKNHFTVVYSNDLPTRLVKAGLYSKIRHPFYTIYTICYFSTAFSLSSILLVCNSFVMLAFYLDAILTEENKFSESILKDEYIEYKKQAGMLYPKISFFKFK